MITRLTRALSITALVTVSLAAPAAAAVINGTSGPDVLVGTRSADTIHGYAGADKLHGKAGNDWLYAGRGADSVYAGYGADHIYGGRDGKRDVLYGGPGNDRIIAWLGDRVYAGRGNDVVRVLVDQDVPAHYGSVYCGPGYDRLYGFTNSWLLFKDGCEEVH